MGHTNIIDGHHCSWDKSHGSSGGVCCKSEARLNDLGSRIFKYSLFNCRSIIIEWLHSNSSSPAKSIWMFLTIFLQKMSSPKLLKLSWTKSSPRTPSPTKSTLSHRMRIESFAIVDHAKVRELSLFMSTMNIHGNFEATLISTITPNQRWRTERKKGRMETSKNTSRALDLKWRGRRLLIM